LHNPDGEVTAVVTVCRDITEYKQAEQVKDDFIGMVSHELRTPLTVVTSAIKTATDKRVSEEERRELLQEANSGAETLTGILDNLLELTRFQAGRLTLDKKPTSIAEVAGMTAKKVNRQYPARKAVLDIPANIPRVSVDPGRLERVMFNLLENSFKYSDEDSEVRVFGRMEKENIVIGVSDHGIGISSQDQKKLFEPFGRLEAGKAKGVGLGLVVCRRLVEAHGGRIWVKSKPGEGSTFMFTIPMGNEKKVRGRK
jgi:K+-sensing histidine kinase KdpD